MHIDHPWLAPGAVEFRGFQANLARVAGQKNTLVVVPTGMGKTVIALLALADARAAGAQRILLLAPTKPLVEQHAAFFAEVLKDTPVHSLTGSVPPSKRAQAYGEGLIIATPQVVQNDLLNQRVSQPFDWVVYDEAHRASGDYPYEFISKALRGMAPEHRRLGLTASPGHDPAKIHAVQMALGLEHIEIRTPADPDVAPYVQSIDLSWETLPLPPSMARVSQHLNEALAKRIRALKTTGFLKGSSSRPTRRDLLEVTKQAQKMIQGSKDPDPVWFQALSQQAQAMKIQHALELAQTQGSAAFAAYLQQMREEADSPKASKATRSIVDDPDVTRAFQIARHDDQENPKMGRIEVLVREQLEAKRDGRVIVFTHFRDTAEQVAKRLEVFDGVRPCVFVGQGKRKGRDGLSQKQQSQMLESFKNGDFNVLVATSVAEEGLDIPETDLVVFYEPIPSEIRTIQRRGRTGRQREGKAVVLMTKGTQDEAAHWTAKRKETQMVDGLQKLRDVLGRTTPPAQRTLMDTTPEPRRDPPVVTGTGPRIFCDSREQSGGVAKHLHEMGAALEVRGMDIGDFILSDRVVVERKTCADFVDSLVDGRLFDQMQALKTYPRPFVVLEGPGLMGHRNVAPEAIWGATAAIANDFGIPLISTRDGQETAQFLLAVARREQNREGRRMAVRPAAGGKDDQSLQLKVLAGLPGVSTLRAEALLARFGTVAAVVAASQDELASVEGIGQTTAAAMRRVLDLPFGLTETVS